MLTTATAIAALLAGSCLAHTGGDAPPDEYEVRKLLSVIEFKQERRTLIAFGERAFPVYLRILANPNSVGRDEVGRIFGVLTAVEADRSRFLEHAVAGLSHKHIGVRLAAVHLLAQIGSARDAPPVVAMLSDVRREVCFAAATTLAAIGGQRALVAFDVWLRTGNHRDDGDLLLHVKKCRDQLKQRLEKEKKEHS